MIGVILVITGFGAPWIGIFYALGILSGQMWGLRRNAASLAPQFAKGDIQALVDHRAGIPTAPLLLGPTSGAIAISLVYAT